MSWDYLYEGIDFTTNMFGSGYSRLAIKTYKNSELVLENEISLYNSNDVMKTYQNTKETLSNTLDLKNKNVVFYGYCKLGCYLACELRKNIPSIKIKVFDNNPISILKACMDNFDNINKLDPLSDIDIIFILPIFNKFTAESIISSCCHQSIVTIEYL